MVWKVFLFSFCQLENLIWKKKITNLWKLLSWSKEKKRNTKTPTSNCGDLKVPFYWKPPMAIPHSNIYLSFFPPYYSLLSYYVLSIRKWLFSASGLGHWSKGLAVARRNMTFCLFLTFGLAWAKMSFSQSAGHDLPSRQKNICSSTCLHSNRIKRTRPFDHLVMWSIFKLHHDMEY